MTLETHRLMNPTLKLEQDVVLVADLRRELAPRVLPPGWREGLSAPDGLSWNYEPPFGRRFKVLMSASRESDYRIWLHVSLSKWTASGKTMETPTWEDIKYVKDLFVGRDRKAIVVLPAAGEYVNISEVHHLWSCLDDDPLPDFRSARGTI